MSKRATNHEVISTLVQWLDERLRESCGGGQYFSSETLRIGPFEVRIMYDPDLDPERRADPSPGVAVR